MRKLLRIPIRIDEEQPPAPVIAASSGLISYPKSDPDIWATVSLSEIERPEIYLPQNQLALFEQATSSETFLVPVGVTSITALLIGASGGCGWPSSTHFPGDGDIFWTTFAVTPGETLDIFVGGGGGIAIGGGVGGVNGGGNGGPGTVQAGGGGGGYSAVKRGATALAIAGGGGGQSATHADGRAGDGQHPNGIEAINGGWGGTQIAGGNAGGTGAFSGNAGASLQGGVGVTYDFGFGLRYGTGGGGGGYFGGGSGGFFNSTEFDPQAGGGGSSYVSTTIAADDYLPFRVALSSKTTAGTDGLVLLIDAS